MNNIWKGVICCVLLLMVAVPLQAQQSRSHNLGNMEYSTSEGWGNEDIQYPRNWTGFPDFSNDDGDDGLDMLHTHGITIGVNRTWTDANGNSRPAPQAAQSMQSKFTDLENVMVPVPGAQTRTFRTPYPTKTLDGTDRTAILASGDPSDSSTPSDVMIYQKATTWTDVDVERWSYSFVNKDHSDYIIMEYVFTNASGVLAPDVYFGFTGHTSSHTMYSGAKNWGTYYGVSYPDYVAGDMTADSMRTWYSWGANDDTQADNDTKGEGDALWGHFREPQYMTYAVLHADKSGSDESDDPFQPSKAGWSQRALNPSLDAGHGPLYDHLSKKWHINNAAYGFSKIINRAGVETTGDDGLFRVLRENFNERSEDSQSEEAKAALLAFGPYQMAAGEDVRIVLAFAGGTISAQQSIDIGAAYGNGHSGQQPLVALPYNLFDLEGNLVLSAGWTGNYPNVAEVAEKDGIFQISKQLALRNAQRALHAWNDGNVRKGVGSFNIPLAPASPSITGFSENDQVRLVIGREAVNDMVGGPAVSYNIYRDRNYDPSLDKPVADIWQIIDNVPASTTEYIDLTVERGQDFYYYITAVNAAGIESSIWGNRTGTSSNRQTEALAPTRGPSAEWDSGDPAKGGVVVVPNPFHIQGSDKYSGKRLNFLNLPAYADIKIYTVNGENVRTIHHDSNTGDKDWERQQTFSTMEVVSGVYIYVVVEKDASGKKTGKKAMGKFVIVK